MSTLPFEFTVEGPPLSHQTRDQTKLKAWQSKVRAAAANTWTVKPVRQRLRFKVAYYHEDETIVFDLDNMVKPIQDALNGLIYIDDRQITYTDIAKMPIDDPFRIRGVSMTLLQAFSSGKVFLHVRVEEAPDSVDALRRP